MLPEGSAVEALTDPVPLSNTPAAPASTPQRLTNTVPVASSRPMGVRFITAPPSAHLPCLQASIRAAEDGPGAAMARAEAWRRRQVVEVMAMPLEQALAQCWPWGDPALSVQLRDQWSAALDEALAQPGVTLAVVPLRVLAETDGALDQMRGAGLDVSGPPWKAGQVPAP